MCELVSVWRWLTDEQLPPRGICGAWPLWLRHHCFASDVAIWLSYMVISGVVLLIWWRKRALVAVRFRLLVGFVFLAFTAFVFGCGLTHFLGALDFFHPFYQLGAAVNDATAVLSLGTALMMVVYVLPASNAVSLREELEKERDRAAASEQRERAAAQEVARLRAAADALPEGTERQAMEQAASKLFEMARR